MNTANQTPLRAPGVFHLWWTHLRLQVAHDRGNYQYLIMNAVLVPTVIFYLAFMIAPDRPDVLRVWIVGGIVISLAMVCLNQVGFAVLFDRFTGRLSLLRTSAITKQSYLAVQLFYAIGLALIMAFVGVALLVYADLMSFLWPQVLLIAGVAVLSGVAVGALGALVAVWAPSQSAGDSVLALAGLGLAYLSPVFYALSSLPVPLQWVAYLSPFTHVRQTLGQVVTGAPIDLFHIAALSILAVIYVVLALRLMRWEV